MIEGEDSKFDEDEGEIVEVAKNIVALSYHHLIIGRDDNYMSAHTVRRAWSC